MSNPMDYEVSAITRFYAARQFENAIKFFNEENITVVTTPGKALLYEITAAKKLSREKNIKIDGVYIEQDPQVYNYLKRTFPTHTVINNEFLNYLNHTSFPSAKNLWLDLDGMKAWHTFIRSAYNRDYLPSVINNQMVGRERILFSFTASRRVGPGNIFDFNEILFFLRATLRYQVTLKWSSLDDQDIKKAHQNKIFKGLGSSGKPMWRNLIEISR